MAHPRSTPDRGRRDAGPGVLQDGRSGEVVFLSHCLLNQNTRYAGGAVCPGVVRSAVAPYLNDGTGIVQLPCPEQSTWGGVPKRRLLWLVDHPRLARATLPLLPLARAYLRRQYARQARSVSRHLRDYLDSGLRVRAVVGVAGSPSCGVHTTLDLHAAAESLTRRAEPATSDWMNTTVIEPALRPGRGLFMDALVRECRRLDIDVPLLEHSLSPPPRATGGGPPRTAGEPSARDVS